MIPMIPMLNGTTTVSKETVRLPQALAAELRLCLRRSSPAASP